MTRLKPDIYESGPIRIAEFDCQECKGQSTLESSFCRECVFTALGKEELVEWVVLKTDFRRTYMSPKISTISRALASLETMVKDRAHYALNEENNRCQECVDERKEEMIQVWTKLKKNPHDLSKLDEIAEVEKSRKDNENCEECNTQKFLNLVKSVKSGLEKIEFWDQLKNDGYDDGAFSVYTAPFFFRGVWKSSNQKKEIIDSYELKGERGKANIYRREDRPVPFYELDLPEMDLPDEHIELLNMAYREKARSAPGHAKFAKTTHVNKFTKDWYEFLLRTVRERRG